MKTVEIKIRKLIEENILSKGFTKEFDLNDNLENIGITSVKKVKLLVAIEAEFDFEFDDEDLINLQFNTLKSLCEYIVENQKTVQN